MTHIDEIICQSINPFDSTSHRYGNFWQEKQEQALTVNSIHQEILFEIENSLQLVASNQNSRTLLLSGDSGSGKSYLLGRLKERLNNKAFFAYIDSWPDSEFIWRHVLRQTVDSLLYKPEGQKDSQLLLWLKGLSAFQSGGFTKWLLGERGQFIHNLQATYPSGIYNPKQFFGVLYDLTNPQLYPIACQWLRGDNLDEEDLKKLNVKYSIETEDAAKNILLNFGRIARDNYPIVLCFDQLDNIPKTPEGHLDLQALFNVNTTIHTQSLKNFLIIISIIQDTWERNLPHIYRPDQARIDKNLRLKAINTQQVEALWAMRLYPLHNQANPQPSSNIYPLCKEQIKINFPRGKTLPRTALVTGRDLFQAYKRGVCNIDYPVKENNKIINLFPSTPPVDKVADFNLVWQKEYQKAKSKVTKITLLAAPELIRMLQEALEALEVRNIKPKLLSGKYAIYSLSYQNLKKPEKVGVIWTEDPNMTSFYHVMKACDKVINQKICQTLYLLRTAGVGTSKLAGNKLYHKNFSKPEHQHLRPSLTSVQYLATYHQLVNAACAQELVVAQKTVSLGELQKLVRESGCLKECKILQDLSILDSHVTQFQDKPQPQPQPKVTLTPAPNPKLNRIKEYVLSLVQTQQLLGKQVLIQQTCSQFSELNQSDVEKLIQKLSEENQVKVVPPNARPEIQSVCWVPN